VYAATTDGGGLPEGTSGSNGGPPFRNADEALALIQGLDAIIYTRDADRDTFDFVSQRAVGLLAHGMHRWTGEPGFWQNTVLHAEDRAETLQRLASVVADGGSVVLEYRAVRADGRTLWLRDHARVARNSAGATIRGLMVDVTDIFGLRRADLASQELEAERRAREHAEAVQIKLARVAQALARSNRDLDQFAYIASHDLKAPLRGIANLTRYLEEDLAESLSADTRELMTLMQTRVRWMQELIDGILTFSRAGRERVPGENVDTMALVRDIVEVLSPSDNVRVEIAPDLPPIHAAVTPLRQVLLNLISNALRFADPESPHVRVGAREVVENATTWVEFAVSDNGEGIAPEFQQRVWQIFQTLQPRDDGGGSGIGLAVVRKLVEQYGGRAWIESEPGAGTTVRFLWPARWEETQEEQRWTIGRST
jgi:signal transduction histidine kinase